MKTLNEFLDEGMVSTLKKGVKRHKDAVEKKKIKDRKAVPYAALAAQHEPEGELVDETYFDSNTRGVSTKGGLRSQYNKPGKLSQSSFSHERKSKDPELRMSKKELRKSMEDDANYEKKMGRSKPTPSNLKTALKKQRQSTSEEVQLEAQVDEKVATGPRLGEPREKGATHVNAGEGEKIQKRTKKWMKKRGLPGAPGLDAMKAREAEHRARQRRGRGVKEEVIDERTLSSYIPSDRQGEAHRANLDYAKAQLKKKEDESTKNRGDLSKRDAGKMAKQRLRTKRIMSIGEDKALAFVIDKLRKQHGHNAVLTKGDKMPELSAAQKKKNAEIRAQRAKEDHRDETEKATSGRYNDRSRSD